jgi:hypothetical protein
MIKALLSAVVCVVVGTAAVANPPSISTSSKWWSYIADYDGKPGSIRVDMAAREVAPLVSLLTVVIFGTKYEQKPDSGLPTEAALTKLNAESDQLIAAVLGAQAGMYVGTFTHNGEQLHYVYTRSAEGTEAAFRNALAVHCGQCTAVYRTRHDPSWKAYLEFLYPNQATLQFYGVNPRIFRSPR